MSALIVIWRTSACMRACLVVCAFQWLHACAGNTHVHMHACMHQCGHNSKLARARAATSEHCRLRTAAVTVAAHCMGHATHVADTLTVAVTVIEALKVTATATLSHSHNCTLTLTNAAHNHGSTLSHGTIQRIVLFLLDQDRPHDTTNTRPVTNPGKLYPKP